MDLSHLRFACLATAVCALSVPADAFQDHAQHGGWRSLPKLDVHFPPGESTVEVPFRSEGRGAIIIDVKVNGSEPVAFVLDTGTPDSVLYRPEKCKDVDLDFHSEAGDGARVARGVRFELGGLRLEGAEMMVMPEDGLKNIGSLPEDGIIGGQLFSSLVVEIDWEKSRVRFHDPATYEAPTNVTAVPLVKRGGHVYISSDVTIGGKSQRVQLVVDTGSTGALSLRSDRTSVPTRRLPEIVIGRSLYGEVKGYFGRTDELRLGGSSFENVLTVFLGRSAHMIAVGSDGNLGVSLLRRFAVTFDYARDRMLLKPTDAIAKPFRFPTSGFHIERQIAADGSIGISHVYADSPAARAGLTAGDRITAVDSRPILDLGIVALRDRLMEAPGTRVMLDVRRADTVRKVELELDTVL